MHYLTKFKVTDAEKLEDAYVTPEGDYGWAIIEAESEEALRNSLRDREIEEVQPLLPAREYAAIAGARREVEDSKRRFVDDPAGALREARQSVSRAMEARGYSNSSGERSNAEEPSSRREVREEYERTDVGESGSLEDQRSAFGKLSGLLERISRV